MAVTVDVLATAGVASREALRGTGVRAELLLLPSTRISLDQLIECYRNAVRLSSDPLLAYRIGSAIHLPAYGMYGFAMLCSPDARRSMEFAVKYHSLAAPVATIKFAECNKLATWQIEPVSHPRIDPRLYAFVTELQMAIHISLHRDTMGERFTPREISLSYSQPNCNGPLSEAFGCPIRYGQPSNRLVYDASWLDVPPRFRSVTNHASVLALCDQELADLMKRSGVVGMVRSIILQDIANDSSFAATAKALQVPPRTLRRQLRQRGTSFQELLDEVRAQIAAKYLQRTVMTNEDIAFALGFSDAANFRHAFRRWTNKTPREYRCAIGSKPDLQITA